MTYKHQVRVIMCHFHSSAVQFASIFLDKFAIQVALLDTILAW
jgi:hypothetical protein